MQEDLWLQANASRYATEWWPGLLINVLGGSLKCCLDPMKLRDTELTTAKLFFFGTGLLNMLMCHAPFAVALMELHQRRLVLLFKLKGSETYRNVATCPRPSITVVELNPNVSLVSKPALYPIYPCLVCLWHGLWNKQRSVERPY